MEVPLSHPSCDHSKNPVYQSHQGEILNLGYFVISDEFILGQGGAQPWLSSATVLPAPCPLYPGQPQFPAYGNGGCFFCIYLCVITTPAGGNCITHIHPLACMLSPENLNPMQAIARNLVKLMELVTQSSQPSNSKTKSREPETFDSSNPEKLQQFLVLLKLNFEARPWAFMSST